MEFHDEKDYILFDSFWVVKVSKIKMLTKPELKVIEMANWTNFKIIKILGLWNGTTTELNFWYEFRSPLEIMEIF